MRDRHFTIVIALLNPRRQFTLLHLTGEVACDDVRYYDVHEGGKGNGGKVDRGRRANAQSIAGIIPTSRQQSLILSE